MNPPSLAPLPMSCTFCDLIQGAAEVSVCYEDADALAFMDIQPVNAGHVLVVPRTHYDSLLDVPPEVGAHLFDVTMRLASAVRRVTGCEGMNLVVNSGVAAGQDVFHYHVHIIPRRKGDGFDIELPFAGSEMPDRTVLDMTAARILAAMRDPMRGGTGGGPRPERDLAAGQPDAPRANAGGGESPMRADAPSRSRQHQVEDERATPIAVHREPSAERFRASDGSPEKRSATVHPVEGAHGELMRDLDSVA